MTKNYGGGFFPSLASARLSLHPLFLFSMECLKGRDPDGKSCACPAGTFNPDFTSHGLHQTFNPRKTQADPRHFTPFFILQLNEPFEDNLLVFRGNPGAVILHGNEQILLAGHINTDAFPSIFQTIADQIPQNLLKLFSVMAERRIAIPSVDFDGNPLRLEKGFDFFLVFETEILQGLGCHHLERFQERFPEGSTHRKKIAVEQIFLGSIDLDHILDEDLSFMSISENSPEDPVLIRGQRTIPLGLV
jgi:hypothetical protein